MVIVGAALGVVLLVACGVAVGYLLPHSTTAASSPAAAAPPSQTGPSANAGAIESEQPTQQGLFASEYPAEKIDDLNRVCDETAYYPQSPKHAGKAPHPLVLLVAESSGMRFQDDSYYTSQGESKTVEQSWAASDPKKVQLVACLDRVNIGSKIRSCKYDDPKPDTVTLRRANWRLRVYEVATGRKLLDKSMAGDDQACPYVVLVGANKEIYAQVSDRSAVAALRNFVNR